MNECETALRFLIQRQTRLHGLGQAFRCSSFPAGSLRPLKSFHRFLPAGGSAFHHGLRFPLLIQVGVAALPGRDFTVFERNGKPVLLLFDKEASTWPDVMKDAARTMVQDNLRGIMSELPRGQQLGDILFTAQPLPRTSTGKVKRWELRDFE